MKIMNSLNSKIQYEKLLDEHYSRRNTPKHLWTTEQIEKIIKLLESQKSKWKEASLGKNYYYYSRNYEVFEKDQKKLLVRKKKSKNIKIHILPKEEFYSILKAVHLATLHGGVKKMYELIKYKVKIPRPAIKMFIKCCTHCSKQKNRSVLKKESSINNQSKLNSRLHKTEFNEMLVKYFKNDLQNCIWTRGNLNKLIQRLKSESGQHVEELKQKLKIVTDPTDMEYVVWKKGDNHPKLIPLEEYFDILNEIHLISFHGGFKIMREFLSGIFHIPSIVIYLYLKCCSKCKASVPDVNFNFDRKLVSHTANINLIEVFDKYIGSTKWLLLYFYMDTEFVRIYPLFSIDPKIISINIFQIFIEFGIPKVLQTDNLTLSFELVVTSLKDLLFDCKFNVEQYRYDIQSFQKNRFLYIKIRNLLLKWLLENPRGSLSIGCNNVQETLNSQFNRIECGTSSAEIDNTEDAFDSDIKSESSSLDSDTDVMDTFIYN